MTVLANAAKLAMMAIAQVIAPPPPIDYLEWAKANVVFSERESPFPGPYNDELFPYFNEILTALGPGDPCRIVTLKKSAQLGGTVVANVFSLGTMDMDPCDFLYVHPTDDNAKRWSRMKLAPMMANTTVIKKLFPQKSRDGGDSIHYKERFDGRGAIQISGANSPSSLSLVTMKRQVQDDLSKWEINAAGDPESQADSRSRAHEFAKIFKNSTPLIEPGCRISKNFNEGSQEYLHVPCPHCDHFHTLEWENMLANLDKDRPAEACFSCPECGGIIEEHHRPAMLTRAIWIAENPSAKDYHRSFYLWSAYSLLQSFETIARDWIKAEGDAASEQVFENDTVGRAYKTRGEAPPWETLRDRAANSDYSRGEIPAGALVLTLGFDCQKDRVEWQLVAWGRNFRRWVIDAGVVPGHVSEKSAQEIMTDLLNATWPNSAGNRLASDLSAIDGNAWTEDVWDWARRHPANKVIMVRGVGSDSAPLLSRVKKERSRRTGKLLKYSKRFYNFGTSVLKMALYRNVAKEDAQERGYVGLPLGLDDDWFQQFTAERRVPVKRRDGFTAYRWEKDATQANEALDTHLQAEAAAIKVGVRSMPDASWDRLAALRETPPADPQLDIEDMPIVNTPASKAKPKRRGRRTLSKGIE